MRVDLREGTVKHRGKGVNDLRSVDAEGWEAVQSQLGGHVVNPLGPVQILQQLGSVESSGVKIDQQAEHRYVRGEVGMTVLRVLHRI